MQFSPIRSSNTSESEGGTTGAWGQCIIGNQKEQLCSFVLGASRLRSKDIIFTPTLLPPNTPVLFVFRQALVVRAAANPAQR